MAKAGLIARLFRRRARGSAPEPTIEGLLAEAMEAGLEGSALDGERIGVEPIDVGSRQGELRAIPSGVSSAAVTATGELALLALFPDRLLSDALGGAAVGSGAPEGPDQVGSLVARLEAGLAALACASLPEDEAEPASHRGSLRMRKRYTAADRDELLWSSAGSSSYLLTVGASSALVFLDSAQEERIRRSLASSRRAEELRSLAAAPDGGEVEPSPPAPDRLPVRFPLDLLASTYFLPWRVCCGTHVVQARLQAASVARTQSAREGAAGEPRVWVAGSCGFGAQRWTTWCAFPAGTPERARALPEVARQIAACWLRATARCVGGALGRRADGLAVTLGGQPDPAEAAACLVLEANLTAAGFRSPCEVWIPVRCLGRLCRSLLDPWDLRQVASGRHAALAAFLSLSTTLLRKRLPELHRELLLPGAARDDRKDPPLFPFAAFVDLVGDADLRLCLQNRVPLVLGARPLRALFSHADVREEADGRRLRRVVTPHAVDGIRIASLLPRQAAEEWNASRAALPDRDGWLAANREVMEDLHRSLARGRLLVSRRARYVLERMYRPVAAEAARAALDELSRSRVPFSELEKLRPPRIQEILGRLPNRTLCLALVGAEAEMPLVRKNTSRVKFALLREELALVSRGTEDGSIELAEAVAARQAIAAEVRRVVEIERRGRASGGGPPELTNSTGPASVGAREEPRDLRAPPDRRRAP